MSGPAQRSISSDASLDGIGVHSGESARLTFRPGEPDSGVVFVRTDVEGSPSVAADVDYVVGTDLGTSLGDGDARVLTVEHVMAAVAAHRIDNLVVELGTCENDTPEQPSRRRAGGGGEP